MAMFEFQTGAENFDVRYMNGVKDCTSALGTAIVNYDWYMNCIIDLNYGASFN